MKDYTEAKKELEAQGINFGKDVYTLNFEQRRLLTTTAKKYGFRPAKVCNSSITEIGGRFYIRLQYIK